MGKMRFGTFERYWVQVMMQNPTKSFDRRLLTSELTIGLSQGEYEDGEGSAAKLETMRLEKLKEWLLKLLRYLQKRIQLNREIQEALMRR